MAKPELVAHKDALPDYQAAAATHPNNVEAQTNLGWGLYSKGRFDEAVKQFEKALALSRDFLDAHYGLALTHKKAGRSKEAIAAFEQASAILSKAEDHARAQMILNIIQSHLNDLRSGR
ncbi:MAG TPA: tetratricopeptide repeat protein [Anaerolineales bacterium]|nr:tetratricopeptide repeat protein [Anaerolineales bacterium]